ncbi:AbrB/MazE/SpoVT family DNA-binding domain-containing protein [Rhizobium sp. TRM95111]|uniref:AbrB/MazE/SpoVT family DNA-binding domain-containing protein n=1 Tax=Rhizobium alarense TaxID=2846851 RepID=UPI001F3AEB2C|nr:AbrB/MazE/SpoVT family DNA-binding domain-containing protein [Rhizobium alarense]MCF3640717.1 AbrB/MazE/SpoVT family DNA-binding domain-containing protein [Rhizobium alarense]
MTVLTVTAKGQVTLRKEFLRHLNAKPGDKLEVAILPDGKLQISAEKPASGGRIDDFFGSLRNPHGLHFTIDELKDEIDKAWATRRR